MYCVPQSINTAYGQVNKIINKTLKAFKPLNPSKNIFEIGEITLAASYQLFASNEFSYFVISIFSGRREATS
jgi:hypothetical protein